MEKTIYFKRGHVDFDLEHFVQSTYLLHVSLLLAKASEVEAGENSERLLWRGGSLEKKPHLVNWVCTLKHRRWLRVRRLDILNKALLGEWSWHLMEKKRCLLE